MDGTIRYCVVKKYKGTFIRKPVYTHLLFIPVDPKKYMYMALVGQSIDDEENKFAVQLLVRLPEEILDETIKGEYEYFGKKFIEVEVLNCSSSNPSQGKYIISIPQKGTYIKSDLEIEYQLEYSTIERRIYILKGELNIISGNVTEEDFDHRPLINDG